jgi:hypothetical protein
LLIAVVVLIVPVTAHAHVVGLSRGDYRVRGKDMVAELTFARPELAGSVAGLDLNQDGAITEEEIAQAGSALDQAIVQKIGVSSPAGVCLGAFRKAFLTEQDGIAIQATYRCHDNPAMLSFQFGFLGILTHGHRHLTAMTAADATQRAVAYAENAEFHLVVSDSGKAHAGAEAVGWSLLKLGIEHILTGYDHLVFLLGLILVGGRFKSLLIVVTAFTVAHSLTLGLATLGVWAPSPTFVEPAIALTIAYVGVENWFVPDAARRWLITFPFGLVHGFGFAGALQEIALPPEQIPLALVAFNLGVEVGQIAVLVPVLPTILWLRRRPWFVGIGVKGMSAGIALAGGWWFISRVA